MAGLKYTKSHEWARIEDGIATVGISDYAQEQLGDVVYVELPDKGRQVEAAGEIGAKTGKVGGLRRSDARQPIPGSEQHRRRSGPAERAGAALPARYAP